jgi:hypothetical protein
MPLSVHIHLGRHEVLAQIGGNAALALSAFLAAACMNGNAMNSVESEAPPIEAGVLAGRDGVAFGPGILLQGNLRRLGLYGFAGRSSITGYSASEGVKASLRDRTLGFGVQYRIARIGKHFAISGFGQAAYYGSHVHATYFDPDHAVTVDYRASDRDPLVTVGPEIDYKIAKGIRIAVRPGKNFGKNFAAETAGGFSINIGVFIDTQSAGINIAKGLKKFLR